jgi:hypothetical protein
MAYGWEVALLVALFYWLVHANIEWLWQMGGVTIPAFLLLAAALAEVDGHAGVLWPRLSARLRRACKQRATKFDLEPPGISSLLFRLLLTISALVVILTAGSSYLAIRFEESAIALAKTDGFAAVRRADSAHWLRPSDPSPFLAQASIYENAARASLLSEDTKKAGAVLDDLALAAQATRRAVEVEPADWAMRYQAGIANINYLLASQYAAGSTIDFDFAATVEKVPGIADWSALRGAGAEVPAAGAAAGSLVADEATRQVAQYYRGLAPEKVASVARELLQDAAQRNPLASQTGEALVIVERIATR